ncbi:unnamed protein product [Polarella glacialis]|uniref:GST N-terminal domain-containing protein n=1 Tax=Polarella glacialis TaxID=89957 RepID=A0A813HVI1_POLGL|nr:unnamed protein product [Polarella glacialis]
MMVSILLLLNAGVLGYFLWLTARPDTSSLSGWRVLWSITVFSIFWISGAYFQWSVLTVLLLLPLAVVIVWTAIRARVGVPQSHVYADPRPRFQLISLPGSHYGEKVRWILDLLQAPYEECVVGGFLTSFFRGRSLPILVDRKGCATIGNSPEIIMYLGAVHAPSIEDPVLRQNALKLMKRDEETVKWEQRLQNIGVAIQGWGYLQTMKHDPAGIISKHLWGVYTPQVTWLERTILDKCSTWFKEVLHNDTSSFLKLTDEDLQERRLQELSKALDEVDAALAKHKFITGDHLSYIDIGFAAQAAPLMPYSVLLAKPNSLFANGRFPEFSDAREIWPQGPEGKKMEDNLHKRPCGQLALRLYAQRGKWPDISATWPTLDSFPKGHDIERPNEEK